MSEATNSSCVDFLPSLIQKVNLSDPCATYDYVPPIQNCLFIANLPQRMTNEELAMALLGMFRPFGEVASVKASRDPKGRPFGFVEFSSSASAHSALAVASCLALDGRRLRVETARKQRKLCIKQWLTQPNKVEQVLGDMRTEILKNIKEGDFKLSVQSAPGEAWLEGHHEGEQIVAAIVKFEEEGATEAEDEARIQKIINEWHEGNPGWSFFWLNTDRIPPGANIRSSGLVHLVPNVDGTVCINPQMVRINYAFSNQWTPSGSTSPNISTSPFIIPRTGVSSPPSPFCSGYLSPTSNPIYPPRVQATYEEMSYGSDGPSLDATRTLPDDEILESWLGYTLFVGRLNSQVVTIPLLQSKFSQYGKIDFIRLYNRLAVGYDGIPLDAYGFIRFVESGAVEEAIKGEHDKVWLGQAMKGEHARQGPLLSMLRRSFGNSIDASSFEVSPPMSPLPLHHGNAAYTHLYPSAGLMPVILGDLSPQSSMNPKSNWFRARQQSL